ncbi:MAG: hypothetical protein F2877_04995 [Actinobacteria bacterium]|nr:hypothetical protein [Actinomycetota bacterium]MSZ29727.1 hypothetical protein [Actinomycetota bacterium]
MRAPRAEAEAKIKDDSEDTNRQIHWCWEIGDADRYKLNCLRSPLWVKCRKVAS